MASHNLAPKPLLHAKWLLKHEFLVQNMVHITEKPCKVKLCYLALYLVSNEAPGAQFGKMYCL